jgi:hypothetical protein
MVISVEGLSLCQLLSRFPLSVFWILTSFLSAVLYFHLCDKNLSTIKTHVCARIKRITHYFTQNPFTPLEWFLLVSMILILILIGTTAYIAPPNNWDSMTYHMSRVAHWAQNQSVISYPTNIERQIRYQPFAEYVILHLQVLTRSDRLANCVQFLSLLGAAIGISLIAKFLKLKRQGQILSSFLCLTIPMAILQGSSTQNDVTVSFFVITSVVFLFILRQQTHIIHSLIFALSLGLALLTKGTAFIYLTPFILWLGVTKSKENNKTFFKHFLIILVGTSMLFAPYLIRYVGINHHTQLGSSLGNLIMQKHSPKSYISNIVRNLRVHLVTPSDKVNEHIKTGVAQIHKLINTPANDPKTTFGTDEQLYNTMPFHEDHAGNPLHLLYIITCILTYSIYKKCRDRESSIYFLCLLSGFLLFCVILKWQPWVSRLQLPLFMLACPFITIVFTRTFRTSIIFFIIGLTLVAALPYLLINESRPLLGQKNIFNTSRVNLYFSNRPAIMGSYKNTVDYISDRNLTQIGLICSEDSWEYPLWVLLKRSSLKSFRIEHIIKETGPLDYPLGKIEPQVIVTLPAKDKTEIQVHDTTFIKTRHFMETSVFRPAAPKRVKENLIYHFQKIMDYSRRFSDFGAAGNHTPKEIVHFKRQFFNTAKSLDLKELAKVHPELRRAVEDKLLPGLKLNLMGYALGDKKQFVAGRQLMREWLVWLMQNEKFFRRSFQKYLINP